jgi:hypothetical protein
MIILTAPLGCQPDILRARLHRPKKNFGNTRSSAILSPFQCFLSSSIPIYYINIIYL